MRYLGTEPFQSITVDKKDTVREVEEKFEVAHRQLYGYTQDRAIEVVASRVEGIVSGNRLSSRRPLDTSTGASGTYRTSDKTQSIKSVSTGATEVAQVFRRTDLQPGDRISPDGTSIVANPFSTVIIDPGWQATMLDDGQLLLEKVRVEKSSESQEDFSVVDPVQLEIFNNHFSSIAEQMGISLQKTAVSVNVKERLDFSCAVFTGDGRLVVNAPHIPVHLGAMSQTVKAIIADNPIVQRDDAFVTNDPYRGGSHLPDVTVVSPVFVNGREEVEEKWLLKISI